VAREATSAFAPDDIRRTASAAASAVIPGLGQLLNGRLRVARWLAIPFAVLVAIVVLVVASTSKARLFASIVSPTAMGVLLALNVVVLAWRLAAVLHAFFDGRYASRSGRAGAAGLALILVAVVAPHGIANAWGSSAQATFARIFAAGPATGPGSNVASVLAGPGHNERLNILVIGIDKTPTRTATLTDSMIVVSVDPVAETVSMVSVPRDLVNVPLGNGSSFSPKINSLLSYADAHPATFTQGGIRALGDAVGALLGIKIHYHAEIDMLGFAKLVDAVGGVDIKVTKAFYDPKYDGLGVNPPGVHGWGTDVGLHHFNGYEALAYARVRKAAGESDLTRAGRQQEILIALRRKITTDGSLLMHLPSLLEAFGGLVTTDLPTDRLPDLAAIADEMKPDAVYRAVLKAPLIKSGGTIPVYGSVQIADVPKIQAMIQQLMPPPGGTPVPWPTPVPGAAAMPGASPTP
jgi:LCP family protein required for cell wall assembly